MSPRRDSSLGLADGLLLLAVVALPWAFGGVEIWAYRSAACLVASAWGIALLARRRPAPLPLDARGWLVPALALIAWAGLQTFSWPVPPPGRDAPFPDTAAVEADALGRLASTLPPAPDGGLEMPASRASWAPASTWSLAPDATRESGFWWGTLLLAALFIAARAEDADRRRAYRAVLLAAFAALATVGLLQAVTWNGRILWVREIDGGRPFGPYVNGDHFAGAMELAVPWFAGLGLARMRRAGATFPKDGRAVVYAAGAALCLAAGLAAQSKFAALAMAGSLAVLALAAAERPAARRRVALGLVGAAAAGAAIIAATPLGGRFRDFFVIDVAALGSLERIVAWKASLAMLADHPVVGIGYGAFGAVFPRYLPAGEAQPWAQLHNDPLEMLVSGGIVGGLLLAWLAVAAIRRLASGHRSIAPGSRRLGNLGLLAGVASLTLHAFVDFNHQIPANALLFVAAAAVAVPPSAGAPEGPR